MKRISVLSCMAMLVAATACAQGSPRGEAKVTSNGKSIAIDYGRPSLRGRDMLGKAEEGQTWRMGAGDPTTLTTGADLSFGPVAVPAGHYTLKAKKLAGGEWQLQVISDQGKTVEIPLAKSELSESVEMFTIELNGEKDSGEFQMLWGNTALKAPFKIQ